MMVDDVPLLLCWWLIAVSTSSLSFSHVSQHSVDHDDIRGITSCTGSLQEDLAGACRGSLADGTTSSSHAVCQFSARFLLFSRFPESVFSFVVL